MFGPEEFRAALEQDEPPPYDGPTAAVAAVGRHDSDGRTEFLFMERAPSEGDPWSGQMAFPGGRSEPADPTSAATAMRETLEEVGLDLTGADWLGCTTTVEGGPRGTSMRLRVTPHVWWLDGERPHLIENYEVASTVWVGLDHLADLSNHVDHLWDRYPGEVWPGILADPAGQRPVGHDRVIWGLTLRMLEDFFRRLGHPLPIEREGPNGTRRMT